jgi:hypothetical protein
MSSSTGPAGSSWTTSSSSWRLDAVRVGPGVARSFEAGHAGLHVLIFGPRVESDAEVIHDFWSNPSGEQSP